MFEPPDFEQAVMGLRGSTPQPLTDEDSMVQAVTALRGNTPQPLTDEDNSMVGAATGLRNTTDLSKSGVEPVARPPVRRPVVRRPIAKAPAQPTLQPPSVSRPQVNMDSSTLPPIDTDNHFISGLVDRGSAVASNFYKQSLGTVVDTATGYAGTTFKPAATPGDNYVNQLATNLYAAHKAEFQKAKESALQGHVAESMGHSVAAAVPAVGPAAAGIGEQIGSGDIWGGLGGAAGLVTSVLFPGKAKAKAGASAADATRAAAEAAEVEKLNAFKAQHGITEAAAADFPKTTNTPGQMADYAAKVKAREAGKLSFEHTSNELAEGLAKQHIVTAKNATGETKGWIRATELEPGKLRIAESELHPDLQGKGHGHKMYQELADHAAKNGITEIHSGGVVSPQASKVWERLSKDHTIDRTSTPEGNSYVMKVKPKGVAEPVKLPEGFVNNTVKAVEDKMGPAAGEPKLQKAQYAEGQAPEDFVGKATEVTDKALAREAHTNQTAQAITSALEKHGVPAAEIQKAVEEVTKPEVKAAEAVAKPEPVAATPKEANPVTVGLSEGKEVEGKAPSVPLAPNKPQEQQATPVAPKAAPKTLESATAEGRQALDLHKSIGDTATKDKVLGLLSPDDKGAINFKAAQNRFQQLSTELSQEMPAAKFNALEDVLKRGVARQNAATGTHAEVRPFEGVQVINPKFNPHTKAGQATGYGKLKGDVDNLGLTDEAAKYMAANGMKPVRAELMHPAGAMRVGEKELNDTASQLVAKYKKTVGENAVSAEEIKPKEYATEGPQVDAAASAYLKKLGRTPASIPRVSDRLATAAPVGEVDKAKLVDGVIAKYHHEADMRELKKMEDAINASSISERAKIDEIERLREDAGVFKAPRKPIKIEEASQSTAVPGIEEVKKLGNEYLKKLEKNRISPSGLENGMREGLKGKKGRFGPGAASPDDPNFGDYGLQDIARDAVSDLVKPIVRGKAPYVSHTELRAGDSVAINGKEIPDGTGRIKPERIIKLPADRTEAWKAVGQNLSSVTHVWKNGKWVKVIPPNVRLETVNPKLPPTTKLPPINPEEGGTKEGFPIPTLTRMSGNMKEPAITGEQIDKFKANLPKAAAATGAAVGAAVASKALVNKYGRTTIVGSKKDNPGMLEEGNVELYKRPVLHGRGGVSTTASTSFNIDGKEVLLPTIIDGRKVSDREAIDIYKATGKHLGVFDSPEHATAYAQRLHKAQVEKLRKQGILR